MVERLVNLIGYHGRVVHIPVKPCIDFPGHRTGRGVPDRWGHHQARSCRNALDLIESQVIPGCQLQLVARLHRNGCRQECRVRISESGASLCVGSQATPCDAVAVFVNQDSSSRSLVQDVIGVLHLQRVGTPVLRYVKPPSHAWGGQQGFRYYLAIPQGKRLCGLLSASCVGVVFDPVKFQFPELMIDILIMFQLLGEHLNSGPLCDHRQQAKKDALIDPSDILQRGMIQENKRCLRNTVLKCQSLKPVQCLEIRGVPATVPVQRTALQPKRNPRIGQPVGHTLGHPPSGPESQGSTAGTIKSLGIPKPDLNTQ